MAGVWIWLRVSEADRALHAGVSDGTKPDEIAKAVQLPSKVFKEEEASEEEE